MRAACIHGRAERRMGQRGRPTRWGGVMKQDVVMVVMVLRRQVP